MSKKFLFFLILCHFILISSYSENLGLTIYKDFCVVRETRLLELKKGISEIKILDVAKLINPETVILEPNNNFKIQILEQNFKYDLIDEYKIFEKYIDYDIKVYTEKSVYEGKLLSITNKGNSYNFTMIDNITKKLIIIDGTKLDRIEFSQLPEGLLTKPALEWKIMSEKDGKCEANLRYMTSGFNWQASYVGIVSPKDDEMYLQSWVTINNNSGKAYKDAELQLVAGEVNKIQPDYFNLPKMKNGATYMVAEDSRGFKEESFFEYHLYSLGRKINLANNETKQLELYSPAKIKIKKEFDITFNPFSNGRIDTNISLNFSNTEENSLGIPLPEGIFRLYKKDNSEKIQFIGEDKISHTAKNDEISLKTGKAFDIICSIEDEKNEYLGNNKQIIKKKITIRNSKNEPISLWLKLQTTGSNFKITDSSTPFNKINANLSKTEVKLNKDEKKEITLTILYSY